jgi:hypothetical protein
MIAAAPKAGIQARSESAYMGDSRWLMLWGPGHPSRQPMMRAQVKRGGHVVALDLAYWSRDRKIRVTIDAAHPQAWVMRQDWPAERWAEDPAPVEDAWKPTGPILIAGLGPKARVQYGTSTIDAWEAAMITGCRARWPGRPIWYRGKRGDAIIPDGAAFVSSGLPIDTALRGTSLVVTWHSNVGVDAIRLGIPVVCKDGAAAAVSPSTLEGEHVPLDPSLRDRFLQNLAWFQWAPDEAPACWQFLKQVLS